MKKQLLIGAIALFSLSTAMADSNFETWTIYTPEFGEDHIFDVTERTFSKKDSLVYEKTKNTTPSLLSFIGSKNTYTPSLSKSLEKYGVSIDSYRLKTDTKWIFSPYSPKAFGDIETEFDITTHDISGKPIVQTVDTARHYLKKIGEFDNSILTPKEQDWLSHTNVFPKGSKCVRFQSITINTPYLEYDQSSERPFTLNAIDSTFSPPRKIGNATFYLNLEDEESSLIKIKDKLYDGSYTSEGNYYSRNDEISMLDDSISEAQQNNESSSIALYQAQQLELKESCNAYNDIATQAISKIYK